MKKLLKVCINTADWSPTRSDWLRLVASLPKSERDRIVSFALKRDSKNTLVGQILVRLCLKRLLPAAVEWPHLVIERNTKGRPCLRLKETLQLAGITDFGANHQIDFNLTHSGDLCAVVAGVRLATNGASGSAGASSSKTSEYWLGVDCMKIDVDASRKDPPGANKQEAPQNHVDPYEREFAKHEKVIRSKFTSSEREYLASRGSWAEKLATFYRIWCLKESYAKATGAGMSGVDASKLEFQLDRDLMIDPARQARFTVTSTRMLASGKLKRECKFVEQYWIPAVNRLDLHVITMCVVETPSQASSSDPSSAETSSTSTSSSDHQPSGGGGCSHWLSVSFADEFAQVTPSDMLDEFVKANPAALDAFSPAQIANSNPKLAKELDDLWANFSKKL